MSDQRIAATRVLNTLQDYFDAYFVGGCVRDMLLGREPKDYDIVTSATPDQIESLFPDTVAVGKAFGVIIVKMLDEQIEVATYRSDGKYSDNRRPDQVTFAKTLREDVQRRDFTMNGLATMEFDCDVVLDFFGGKEDIDRKLIRCIGDPNKRFQEDALRMLRAIRFAAQLGFTIYENPDGIDTWGAIKANAELIKNVSRERVCDELLKILASPNPTKGIELLIRSGLCEHLFPSLMNIPFAWTLKMLDEYSIGYNRDPIVGMAVLLCQSPDWPLIGESLKLSGEQRFQIADTIVDSNYLRESWKWDNAQCIRMMRHRYSHASLELFRIRCHAGPDQDHELPEQVFRRMFQFTKEQLNPEPLINGDDLLARGYKGAMIGHVLSEVETKQLNGELYTREEALAWVSSVENATQ